MQVAFSVQELLTFFNNNAYFFIKAVSFETAFFITFRYELFLPGTWR